MMPRRPARVLLLGVRAMAITWIWPILTAAEPEVAKGCVMECTPNRYASRIIPLRFLKSYQNSTCHGTFSVILTTVRERTYCARPSDDWVQKAMRELDAKDAARSMPRKPSVTHKLTGAANPTSGWAVGPAHPTGTATSVRNAFSAGLMPADPSPQTTSKPELAHSGVSPNEPESPANGNANPNITATLRTEGFGEGFGKATPQMPLHATHTTLLPSRLSSSGLSKESVTPSQPLSVSTLGKSLLSDSTGDLTSQTTLDLTTVAQRKDSTSQLSTRPAADERNGTTMSVKDRNDATKDPTVTIGQHLVSSLSTRGSRDVFPHSPTTLPTSGFHQENMEEGSRGLEIEKTPEVTLIPASILPKYQTYTVSMTVAGVVFILLVGIAAWAYFKTHMCARKPRQRIRGLVYSPVDSYANDFPMQNLLVIRGTDFAPCVGAGQAWSGKHETDGSFFVFNPLPEDTL
ncbi:hypothetical protein JRQ81_006478 [Phrynocephalus forsythii]|uniref:Chemokine interleukin-8-like domain-containing protein n=1 Tax=Phrynocephalus forsythii TaxID=171643 RepID=A0A9Q1AUD7_9SAUR|nr:hypothetical protein JRQ81_006478 [Phrynocephalus forsythii]